jgi:pimeloyl-ACP methyl ester carboxylesterase
MLGVLACEDLHDVILIGHSYGGMVATGVADRARKRIAQLVYLDAFVPRDGQSLFDLQNAEARKRMREMAASSGNGWRIPPNPMPPDTLEADIEWILARRLPQPIRTFDSPLRLLSESQPPPRSYIYCKRCRPDDVFRQFAERAQREPGWRYFEIDASHNPHITAPEALLAMLEQIASARPASDAAAE